MAARKVTAGERRARLGRRHHLATEARGTDVVEVARDIVAFHATDPASVYLSAWARMVDVTPEDIAAALYDHRSLVRMLGMRRTMFVLPADERHVVQGACTDGVAARETRRIHKLLADLGVEDPEAWFAVSVHHQPGVDPTVGDGPHAVAMVELPEGVRMMSPIVGCALEDITVGMAVRVTWLQLEDGRHLPQFGPA